jgi:hypothetical protein
MIQCPQVERENAACPDLDEGPKQQAILIILMGWSVLYLILESKMKEAFLCKNGGSILGLLSRGASRWQPIFAQFWIESFRVEP